MSELELDNNFVSKRNEFDEKRKPATQQHKHSPRNLTRGHFFFLLPGSRLRENAVLR